MLDLRHNKSSFHRSFRKMALMVPVLLPGIFGAQEIYDPGNSLFVAEGTEIHVSVPSPETSLPAKKAGPEPGNHQIKADKATEMQLSRSQKRSSKASTPEKETPKPAFVYTGKESSHFTSGRQETHLGILVPASYTSKAPAAALLPCRLHRIRSAEDFTQHKFLYKESHRRNGISYSNSCRPPPNVFMIHLHGFC